MHDNELQFKYFLYSDAHSVTEPGDEWNSPLKLERRPGRRTGRPVTLGDYFTASRKFLESVDLEKIMKEVRGGEGVLSDTDHIESIQIRLEKHGAFYHPSRIAISPKNAASPFMLNVAVSESGLGCIKREFSLLNRLYKNYPVHFIPCVYAESEASCLDGRGFEMFLGEWFEGFSEFHITETSDGKSVIGVWDSRKGLVLLPDWECEKIYEQAAMIHTYYFDIISFERIHPWHHAAGDFIVHETDEGPELRLVTVRDYTPMIVEPAEINESVVLAALLMFFVDLSIRMRLDRINGDGAIAWAPDSAVQGTVNGFYKGLDLKRETGLYPDQSLEIAFHHYISQCALHDFHEIAQSIIETYSDSMSDIEFIQSRLTDHLFILYESVQKDAAERINTFFIDKE